MRVGRAVKRKTAGGSWATLLAASAPMLVPVKVADIVLGFVFHQLQRSSTTVNLAPHATAILEAPDVGTLNQGYVTASLPGGVTGYGVFRQTVAGVPDQEAGCH